MKKYPVIAGLFSLCLLSFSLLASANPLYTPQTVRSISKKVVFGADFQFQEQLTQVFLSSQLLVEALAAEDVKKAREAAKLVEAALNKVNKGLLPDEPKHKWAVQSKVLHTCLAKIAAEASLKDQRACFAEFSAMLAKSLKTFGIEGEVAYYAYCPMALNGDGAYWLSNKKQILNPYLGAKMPGCGSIKEIIK